MTVRPCGCTYRATGSDGLSDAATKILEYTARRTLQRNNGSMKWGELCDELICRDHSSRDTLHRILHEIAEPEVTPTEGRGRKGTLWRLISNG